MTTEAYGSATHATGTPVWTGTPSIKRVGAAIGAVLAVPYVTIVLGSQLLVGTLTTGAWQAALLGITWQTLIGFELGLVAAVGAGFAAGMAWVAVANVMRQRWPGQSTTRPRRTTTGAQPAAPWPFGLRAASLVLPVVFLAGLRSVAPFLSSDATASISELAGHRGPANLGAVINTAFREAEPSFTGDGRTMYFNCYNGDICVSHLIGTWDAGSWTAPERLGAPINTEYEEIEPIINGAGDKLYFTSIRPTGGLTGLPLLSPFVNVARVANSLLNASYFGRLGLDDVYVSYYVDGTWSQPRSINDVRGEPPINTPFADHCLFFSADRNEAFWTSTRPGGLGADDIWTSRRVDGKWTDPENLGPHVNSAGSEHHSIPTPDGQSLYVTTTRPSGFGGEDSYLTTRGVGGEWGPLVNLGPLVNGPGDDRCPAWTPDYGIFLFDSVRDGGFGGRDIAWVYLEDVLEYPRGTAGAAAVP